MLQPNFDIRRLCTYCGRLMPTTRDHVFPRSFFRGTTVTQAVTVKACNECNQHKKEFDTYVRDMIAIDSRYNKHPVADGIYRGPLKRSIERNQTPLRFGVKSPPLREVELFTETGIYVEQAIEVVFDDAPIREWLRYVVQGLTRYHFQALIPHNFPFFAMVPNPREFEEQVTMFGQHREFSWFFEQGEKVVQWAHLSLRPDHTVWMIVLYERLAYTIPVLPPDQLEILRERRRRQYGR